MLAFTKSVGWSWPFRSTKPAADPVPQSPERVEPTLRATTIGTQRPGQNIGAGGRKMADWITGQSTADVAIRRDLHAARNRSRDLAMNDPHGGRFFKQLTQNVLGKDGIRFQARFKLPDGTPDKDFNAMMEREFQKWSQRGTCTVDGMHGLKAVNRLALLSAARDGDFLSRLVFTNTNKWGLSLQLIEADLLDHNKHGQLPNDGQIRMGKQFDKNGRPTAYWLLNQHPGEDVLAQARGKRHQVVDAKQIIHVFMKDRIGQSRGSPWLLSSITPLRHTAAYNEAALIAARAGASKMGFYEEAYPGALKDKGKEKTERGATVETFDAGTIGKLPTGIKFSQFDPGYPHNDHAPFMKVSLRGVAAGMNVSYNNLTFDLEGVNFSSLRQGNLEEREGWMQLQGWFVDDWLDPLVRIWVFTSVLRGVFSLNDFQREQLDKALGWQTRGWPWVDPLKDQQANEQGLANGTRTRRDIANEQGHDWEAQMEQLALEQERARELNVTLGVPSSQPRPVELESGEP